MNGQRVKQKVNLDLTKKNVSLIVMFDF